MTASHMAVSFGNPGAQFNRHFVFRMGLSDKSGDKLKVHFREGQFKTCFKTPNIIRDGFGDDPKMSIEMHPRLCEGAPEV